MAISRRATLVETVTDVLVERGNRDVALSVARNAGANPAGLITDQRGDPRGAGAAADIGAVEMAVAAPAPAAAPTLPAWAALLLGVLLGCTGWLRPRRRRRMDGP